MTRFTIPYLVVCTLLVLVLLHSTECKRRKGSISSAAHGILSSGRRRFTGQGHNSQPARNNQGARQRRGSCPPLNSTCPTNFSSSPLILIALDGFRSDYLGRGLTPTLERLSTQCGLKAQHMRPSFPTTTFPNLYTIVTGLFPESHGLIDNEIYDPQLREKLDKDRNWNNSIWWQKDPIWVSAEKQGKKAACYFWLGSDVAIHGVRPSHFRVYNPRSPWTHRIQTVLDWLDMPEPARPSFITLYFNQPDNDGHKYGPDSRQVNSTLRNLDSTIASLVNGLEQRGILGCVNVMIVSDHGMTGKSCSRVVPLDRYLDLSSVYYVTGAASRVRPKGPFNSTTIDSLVSSLRCKTDKLLVARKEELPKRFHFSASNRIEPVVLGPAPGWVVRRSNAADPSDRTCTGGTHGYDNMADEMKALFVAFGPAFKRNITVAPFSNVELYSLMTDLVGVSSEPNNGTKGSLYHLLRNPPTLNSSLETTVCSIMPSNGRTNTSCVCQNSTAATTTNVTDATTTNVTDATRHLPWGNPGCSSVVLSNPGSVVGHRPDQDMPAWAAFTLPALGNETSNVTSTCWTTDSRVPNAGRCYDGNITLAALAPAVSGHRLLTSGSPMYPGFQSGAYGHLVRLVNQWSANGTINVVTGPAFDYTGNGVAVTQSSGSSHLPTHYFMVLTRCLTPGTVHLTSCPVHNISVLAFLLPHKENRENCLAPRHYLMYHACRVRDVETLTGLRFFTNLEPQESARIRTMLPEALWT